jgi:NAD(P)-dependent dehydrogenase (short-subunit alcohol dehydrogenase family)
MTHDITSLEGKLVLVTGAGVGIGQGVALELAKRGADVVLHYATSARGALDAVDQIQAMGRRSSAVQADLGQVPECYRLVDEAARFLGGLDALVSNAGISTAMDFLDTTEALFDQTFNINIRGQYFCAQRAVPYMLERGKEWDRNHPDTPWPGGCIINMSSVQAFGGVPKHTAYAATKGAINSFTQTAAIELAPRHIRVNAVAPGTVEVPRYAEIIAGYTRAMGNTMAPWGRVGLPEDIGHMVAFLVSDAAEWITGQVFRVDGGLSAKLAIPVEYKDKEY